MASVDARIVASLLREYAQRTALRGGNPYRAKAYSRAADSLAALAVPLHVLIAEDRLTEIPGVGEAIADMITKLHKSGTHPHLEKLRKEFPEGVLEMLSVPGLRPEKVLRLYKDLGITSLAELEAAAKNDRIKKAKGFGRRPADQDPAEPGHRKKGRRSPPPAPCCRPACARQGLASQGAARAQARDDRRRIPPRLRTRREPRGRCGVCGVCQGRQDAEGIRGGRIADPLVRSRTLRRRPTFRHRRLETDGLHKGRTLIAGDEVEIYRALGLPFIDPELREGRGEIELALKGKLPKLVTDNDLRGILHCHTDASDGTETLETMAKATRQRGFEYFGVADHSKSAHYAGGLSVEEIAQQHREADRLNKRFGKDFRILKGIESDILADGSLDYANDVLEGFDFILASIHGRFKLDRKAQTQRLLRAVSDPHTTIIGHMTGRQLQRRPGYEIDVEKVLRACAKHDVVVEINAHPWRLDLDWRWHQAALDFGCMLSINPDAHSIPELDHMHWGVEMARKGGVPADRVLNAMPLPEITRYLRQKRRSFARAA
ncbi:DNA polymerase (family 10) [Bradyrhizobium sp. GM22.5]